MFEREGKLVQDHVIGFIYGLYYSRKYLIHSYGLIPIGILLVLTILYGLNQLIVNVFKIKFPASVMGMLINLIFLCVLSFLSNVKYKKVKEPFQFILHHYLRLIQPSMNFSLKWINICFVPSFIILPLSKPITIVEVGKIAAVFTVGWIALLGIDVYLIQMLKWLFSLKKKTSSDGNTMEMKKSKFLKPFTTMRDITTIDLRKTEPGNEGNQNSKANEITENENDNSITIERPEPAYSNSHSTPNIFGDKPSGFSTIAASPERTSFTASESMASNAVVGSDRNSTDQSQPSTRNSTEEAEETNENNDIMEFSHLSKERQRIVMFVTQYIDWVLYLLLLLASFPLYYVRPYHLFLPFHLSATIIAYFIALLIPAKWPVLKKFAHPILVSTFFILLFCFINSMIYHFGKPVGFLTDLKYYKTGKNYLNLFSGKNLYNNGVINDESVTKYPIWPGCGDLLSSLMDVSIVSLSLPVYTHRKDFINNFWLLVVPLLVSLGLTFFLYPIFCYNIGISPSRSIGFIGRSVTLALGTPLIDSLEGSVSLMAVCTILSGIIGVLIGDPLLTLLRIPSNDYVTRGVSLGINCGAIATAHLLTVDPRAASMSSLSFTMFGTIMIILSSIGSVRSFIHGLVGM